MTLHVQSTRRHVLKQPRDGRNRGMVVDGFAFLGKHLVLCEGLREGFAWVCCGISTDRIRQHALGQPTLRLGDQPVPRGRHEWLEGVALPANILEPPLHLVPELVCQHISGIRCRLGCEPTLLGEALKISSQEFRIAQKLWVQPDLADGPRERVRLLFCILGNLVLDLFPELVRVLPDVRDIFATYG